MNREEDLTKAKDVSVTWDIIVIGGGATGAGCALDAASRGFSVLLLEQHDFGKGTSSRSTKLIHGGVRYLRQGNISLVRKALKERGLLLRNAPHAIRKQPFIIPCYGHFEKAFYGLGMKIYDRLSGSFGIGDSRLLSREETLKHLPTLREQGLRGGVLYFDCQFDDTRLLIDILRTARANGAVVLNYAKVTSLAKDENGKISGVEFEDVEKQEKHKIAAKCVINATGAFCDPVRLMSDPGAKTVITFAQGVHLVLSRKFQPSEAALMIPKTSDGRVLFGIPWHDHLLVGTTDTAVKRAELEPRAVESEIEFILETAGNYLTAKPTRKEILSVFAGVRPLIRSPRNDSKTSSLSRGHDMFVDDAGLVTVTGGKWTTYRQMAEDAVDKAIEVADLTPHGCITEGLSISPPEIAAGENLHPAFDYKTGDVIRAVDLEMARTAEDVLARRTRMLFLNADAAIAAAPGVIELIAQRLDKDDLWISNQLRQFREIAAFYRPTEQAEPYAVIHEAKPNQA
ncbi:MAG TPA: glycerol-3-phosphate dehydrogenase/oxidase [Pyrinomonadaceae bacterium]|nr:glycerol-3-phosphate dehydrogenase/oxidase [Pyrinomonadaceae bacterium]